MKSLAEIIEIIKNLKKMNNDYEVANILKIRPKTLAAAKVRNSIPFVELAAFCKRENISLNWLLMGTGSQNISEEIGAQDHTTQVGISPEYSKDFRLSDALTMAARVLESGSSYATALYLNIQHFDRAIRAESRIAQVEKTQGEIEQRSRDFEEKMQAEINELRKEVNRLKATYESPSGENRHLANTNTTE